SVCCLRAGLECTRPPLGRDPPRSENNGESFATLSREELPLLPPGNLLLPLPEKVPPPGEKLPLPEELPLPREKLLLPPEKLLPPREKLPPPREKLPPPCE